MNPLNFLLQIPAALAQKTVTTAAGDVADATTNQFTAMVVFVLGQIPLWITAFIVLIVSFILARVVKSAVENRMAVEGLEEEHKEIQIVAGRAANAMVLIVGITAALKIAGLDLTAIIAAGAFGVGFALQDLIMNFLAGVMILSARHYKIGDFISVGATKGKIVEIQTRATILKSFDGTKVVVPNAVLFKNQVISYTSNPFRRIQLVQGVSYDENLKRAIKVILAAVKNTRGILVEPKASISLFEWGDFTINMKINAWIDSHSSIIKIKNRLIVNITKAFADANMEIPYPIQTVLLSDSEKEQQKLKKIYEARRKAKKKAESAAAEIAPAQPVAGLAQPAAEPTTQPQIAAQPVQTAPAATATETPPAAMPLPQPAIEVAPDWLKKATDALTPSPAAAALNTQPVAGIAPAPAMQAIQPEQIPAAASTAAETTAPQPMPQPQLIPAAATGQEASS